MKDLKVTPDLSQLPINHLETVLDKNVIDKSNVALLFYRLHDSVELLLKIHSKKVRQNQRILALIFTKASNNPSQIDTLAVIL